MKIFKTGLVANVCQIRMNAVLFLYRGGGGTIKNGGTLHIFAKYWKMQPSMLISIPPILAQILKVPTSIFHKSCYEESAMLLTENETKIAFSYPISVIQMNKMNNSNSK